MATKLPTQIGHTYEAKKLWKHHQDDEFKRVSNYKESYCWICMKKKECAATVIDVCTKCAQKRGPEALLATISKKYYGFCFLCATYQFNIGNVNARFCPTCYRMINLRLRKFAKEGGMFGADPYWKHIRKKHGKDWKLIMSDPSRRNL